MLSLLERLMIKLMHLVGLFLWNFKFNFGITGMQGASCTPDSHPYRITSTKCRINTVVSPDVGHIVA